MASSQNNWEGSDSKASEQGSNPEGIGKIHDQQGEEPVYEVPLNASLRMLRVTSFEKSNIKYEPVVQKLVDWLKEERLMDDLKTAVENALRFKIKTLEILNIKDPDSFLAYANKMLFWVPQETFDGRDVYYHIVMFYFVLNQPPMNRHQSRIIPRNVGKMSWLSRWLVDYAQEVGKFCDKPESLTEDSLKSFYDTPSYKMSNYIKPRGGWKTFNQFFARDIKPGFRTIYGLSDPTVVVSPADCTFSGSWDIDSRSHVTLKHLQWSISDLLRGSRYGGEFKGGVFTHSFLNTFDYHRLHTPVEGQVLESFVIEGQVYLETVVIKENEESAGGTLIAHRNADAPDSPGYQFVQTRGLVVVDSPIGLVAVLPIGMATVSSVIMTAEERCILRKGEEIGYFQFGGSDIVVVYQAQSKVRITAVEGIHISMGMPVATATVQP